MGTPKCDLPFGQETMLERIVRLLKEAVAGPVIIVTAVGQEIKKIPQDIIMTCDRCPDIGPLEGLAVGLRRVPEAFSAAYVTSCDTPMVSKSFIHELASRLLDCDAVVPDDGKPHPLSAIYRTSVADRIDLLLGAGHRRLRDLLDQIQTCYVSANELQASDPELQSLWNLNTPLEYAEALKFASFE